MNPWQTLVSTLSSPLERLAIPLQDENIRVWLKRDDLLFLETNHQDRSFCGNKWRKLKYNLLEAKQYRNKGLITFGGAFSNHLAAVAAAGALFQFKTVGIVRGEAPKPFNATLRLAQENGMQLFFVSRSSYREKEQAPEIKSILDTFPEYFLLPEGGTNTLAMKGCQELAQEIIAQLGKTPEIVAAPFGTGGTAAGLICGLPLSSEVAVFPALKGEWINQELERLIPHSSPTASRSIIGNYHFGGYARYSGELVQFIQEMNRKYRLPLDPIYTGKMVYGVMQELKKGRWKGPVDLVVVHTGGLQACRGYEERYQCTLS